MTAATDMPTLFVADKKLGELEALFACEISDDDDFYDVLAFNLTRLEPRYFLDKLGRYQGPRLRGAVFGLGHSTDRSEQQKAALAALLYHPDPLIVAEAIDALRRSKHLDLWQQVGALIGHAAAPVRGAVARFARQALLPEEAFLVLTALLGDADPLVRQNAIDELAELGDRRAIDPIRRFLKDPDEDVRLAAASAINTLSSQP
jgi:HEAT repeat protein